MAEKIEEINNYSDWFNLSKRVCDFVEKQQKFTPFRVKIYWGRKRTIKQNALLHAVFEDISRLVGAKSAEWWKNDLKLRFGKKVVHLGIDNEPCGIILESTAKYSTVEMANFLQAIVAYIKATFNKDVLLPDELQNLTT